MSPLPISISALHTFATFVWYMSPPPAASSVVPACASCWLRGSRPLSEANVHQGARIPNHLHLHSNLPGTVVGSMACGMEHPSLSSTPLSNVWALHHAPRPMEVPGCQFKAPYTALPVLRCLPQPNGPRLVPSKQWNCAPNETFASCGTSICKLLSTGRVLHLGTEACTAWDRAHPAMPQRVPSTEQAKSGRRRHPNHKREQDSSNAEDQHLSP